MDDDIYLDYYDEELHEMGYLDFGTALARSPDSLGRFIAESLPLKMMYRIFPGKRTTYDYVMNTLDTVTISEKAVKLAGDIYHVRR